MRRIPQEAARLRAGQWQTTLGTGLRGRTLGIWCYGKIGSLVAGYGRAFAMRVLVWGRDHTLTLRHFAKAFAVEWTPAGILWSGGAWNSLWNTLRLAAAAAPLSAAVGLLTAYLLDRVSFAGQRAFELGTLLSFAVPGTVICVAYVLAFNVPPLELTGGGLIIVLCLVFYGAVLQWLGPGLPGVPFSEPHPK